ncbi:PTS sugar transporter subunit IIA [Sporomusa malonica]|uniref:PTS system, glucose-specific IIA component n=1 Tax=Sporomusa malonica TaxID=112901 RepID=A0A1W1ZQF3_9FIRM|nr:PTS glucose transporter subunit IIA [Sporomusa malonica]SMC50770.1 PTS system, glucose-specific IIA component [Sporomusa malonica]
MFNLFKSKKTVVTLYSPVKGRLMDITQVPDPVFAGRMMGDGLGVEPAEGVINAPCSGEILLVPKTLHAVALKTGEGLEVLIHVGLDTVELGGQGFIAHVQPGDRVTRGDKLLTFNQDYIQSQGKSLITPIVITNMAEKVAGISKFLDKADGIIMEVEVRR